MPQRIEFEGKLHEFPDDFTDADIAAALGSVEHVDRRASGGSPSGTSTAIGVPAAVLAGRGLASGAVRAGEEIATSPLMGRLVKAATGRATGAIVGAVAGHGATGGAIGYGIGEAASQPAVQTALTAAARSGGGMLARLGGLASRYAGPVGVITSALTADSQPTSGPVADQARQAQQIREAEFIRQHPEYRRATDVDLPREQPINTRALAMSEVQKLIRGTK
jgi:hypothetical protein